MLYTSDITFILVSIHTPTQGVTAFAHSVLKYRSGFNPHTHAGCDCDIALIMLPNNVSIHTPTQGVTRFTYD